MTSRVVIREVKPALNRERWKASLQQKCLQRVKETRLHLLAEMRAAKSACSDFGVLKKKAGVLSSLKSIIDTEQPPKQLPFGFMLALQPSTPPPAPSPSPAVARALQLHMDTLDDAETKRPPPPALQSQSLRPAAEHRAQCERWFEQEGPAVDADAAADEAFALTDEERNELMALMEAELMRNLENGFEDMEMQNSVICPLCLKSYLDLRSSALGGRSLHCACGLAVEVKCESLGEVRQAIEAAAAQLRCGHTPVFAFTEKPQVQLYATCRQCRVLAPVLA